jgi:hypothetical protein
VGDVTALARRDHRQVAEAGAGRVGSCPGRLRCGGLLVVGGAVVGPASDVQAAAGAATASSDTAGTLVMPSIMLRDA